MNEKSFEELLLDRFDKIDNRLDKIDNRLDRMDDRMTAMDDRMTAIENKLDEKTSAIENKLGTLAQETAQIRGKLETRAEFFTDLKSWIAIAVASAAVIFAWLK